MNDLERRLSVLLHTGAPEPERLINSAKIAGLAQGTPTLKQGRPSSRWGVPLLAAAAVVVAVAIPAVIISQAGGSAAPISPSPVAPAPATASIPAQTSPATSSPTSTTNVPPAAAGTCLTSQLRLAPGPTNGAAGSLYTTFTFTNTTGTPCVMRGFPGVSLLDPAGVIVGQPATRDGSSGPSVRLGAAQRAAFTIRVGTATRTGCTVPRPSSQIEVYPPGQTVPLRIPFTTGSCAVSVQSVTAVK
ncbi:MAG: DUF4232 domain-containing protein [Dermatophilaceae bacterium]